MKEIYHFRKLAFIGLLAGSGLGLRAQVFHDTLPIPPLAEGSNFTIHVHDAFHDFSSYPLDSLMGVATMGYDVVSDSGSWSMDYLGPTLNWVKGDAINITVQNDLVNMMDTTTVHWHGAHVPAMWDGGPHQPIAPMGGTWSPNFTVLDEGCTLWYHPHLHHMTYAQVSLGLAGMIRVTDPTQPMDTVLPHHYGIDEIPLVIQDKFMKWDASLGRDTIATTVSVHGTTVSTAGFFPNYFFVNGIYHPKTTLPKQTVMLRLLNGARTVNFNLSFTKGSDSTTAPIPFKVVGSDNGLLDSAYTVTRLMITPGERWIVTLDLDAMTVGDSLTLWTVAAEIPNGIDGSFNPFGGNLVGKNVRLARFHVGPTTTTTAPKTSTPDVLIPIPTVTGPAANTRTKYLQGNFPNIPMFDNLPFNEDIINDYVYLNSVEEWTLINTTDEGHPFHLHDVSFFVTDTSNVPITHGIMKGAKDMIMVPPFDTITFITKFTDFADSTWEYMYHCHILAHEDQGMMHQWIVWDSAWGAAPYTVFVADDQPLDQKDWSLYPNPTSGSLWLKGESGHHSAVSITDLSGRVLMREYLEPFKGEQELQISSLPAAMYLVRWETSNGTVTKKVIVE